jgi:hypothetical protein
VKFRRRYQVVVEGVSGQAAAQRTVVSEHRSEHDALEAARVERSRLEVIHGGAAASWRILVMLDQQIVAEEMPQAEGDDLLNGRPPEGAAQAEAEAPVEPEPGRPDEPEESDRGEEPARAAAEPAEEAEPPPEGRVPDWVIRRFEESITRRGEREERAPEGDEEGPSQPLP